MRTTSDSSDLSRYVESAYAIEDAPLAAIRARIISAGRPPINISASEGRTLQILLRLSCAHRAVEIGTLFGYSAVWIARSLGHSGHLDTIERDHECVRAAKQAFLECGVEKQITVHEGEASDILSQLSKGAQYDAVFIDANKSAYVEYLDWAFANLRKGGLLIADNTLLGGAILQAEKPQRVSNRQWSEMREFNHRLADQSKWCATILPTSEGLSVAIKL